MGMPVSRVPRRLATGARWSAALVALLLLAACGGRSSPTTAVPTADATVVPTATGKPSAAASPTSTGAAGGTPAASPTTPPTPSPTPTAAGPVAWRVESVATGLDTPWEIAFLPDGRIFVTERPGRVRVIQDGQLLPNPVATIDDVTEAGEGGLLGMALAPDFAQSHHLYLYYTYTKGGVLTNHVVRYTESNNTLTEPTVILDDIPAASNHDGGRLAFGPDGKLYVTAGDASQADLAQDTGSVAGKILRINADGSIPDDNPFPGSPVYSYGHRNPEGLAWQPGTNQLYATEHGPSAHDEVNVIKPGANYGWPAMRGNEGENQPGFTPPLIESGAGNTWAPTGATFVRGDTFPQWKGDLLYTSLRGQSLWHLDISADGSPPALEAIISGDFGRLRDVVEAPDGTLYVLTSNQDGRGSPSAQDDQVLRIVPQAP